MKSYDDIEQSIRQLRRTTSAETDQRIVQDAVEALEKSAGPDTGRKRIFKIRLTRLAAAAVIIIIALAAVHLFVPPEKTKGPELTEKTDFPETIVEQPNDTAQSELHARLEAELEMILERNSIYFADFVGTNLVDS